jgi:phosphate-selective porin O/P
MFVIAQVIVMFVAVLSANLIAAATPASAQIRFTFQKRPSVEVPGVLTVDLCVKSQNDFRGFPVEPGTDQTDVFDLHRARVGVEGTIVNRFDYQVEREFSDATQPWRDVYVNARALRGLELRAGQFKIPSGRRRRHEQLLPLSLRWQEAVDPHPVGPGQLVQPDGHAATCRFETRNTRIR